MLIPPRFLSLPYREAKAAATLQDGIGDKEVDAVDISLNNRVTLVCGDPQSGMSSALLWLLSKAYERDGKEMPAYLRGDHAALGRAKEKASLRKAAGLFGYEAGGDDIPDLALAIDDCHRASDKRIGRIAAFINDNQMHRYLLGTTSADWTRVSAALDDAGVDHERVFLAELGRRDLRALAKTVSPGAEADTERIFGLVQSQNLPRNPFTLIALIAVLQAAATAATDLNETSLLQAYARLLLGGDELVEVEQLGMDYSKRVHLLGEIAHLITESGKASLPGQDVEAFVLSYFRERALQLSSGEVLTSLILRGILVRRQDEITFSNPAFRELFLAEWIRAQAHHERQEEMLSKFPENAASIVHVAALDRDNKALLEGVAECARGVIEQVMAEVPLSQVDEILESGQTLGSWNSDNFGQSLELLPAGRRSEAELDEEIDRLSVALGTNERDTEGSLAEAVSKIEPATALLSDVLKNCELVDDVRLKHDLLRLSIQGWVTVLGVVIASDAHEESLREITATSLDDLDPDDEEKLTAVLLLVLVIVTTIVSFRHLGSRHLVQTIQSVLDDSEVAESASAKSLLVWLETQLDASRSAADLEALLEELPEGSFIYNVTMALLLVKYRTVHDEGKADSFLDVLVDTLDQSPEGGPAASIQRDRSRQSIRSQLVQSRRAYQGGVRREVESGANPASLPMPTDDTSTEP